MTNLTPITVSDLDLALSTDITKMMPPMSEIPSEFKGGSTVWSRWQAEWFYSGLSNYPTPKEGINIDLAMRHLATIQNSFEPSHEHKRSAVAYLASLWFEKP